MSPELIKAIRERLHAGQEKETIKTDVLAQGHSESIFEAAFTLAIHDQYTTVATAEPSVRSLITHGVKTLTSRLDLGLLLAVPMVLTALITTLGEVHKSNNAIFFTTAGFTLLAMLAYVLVLGAVLYIVTHENETPTYTVAFSWSIKNIFSLLFIYILTGLVIGGGFLLLIVPGVTVLVSVYFSQYVFAKTGVGGMRSLLASRSLVHGRWWLVAQKLAGLLLLAVIPLAILGSVQEVLLKAQHSPWMKFGTDSVIEIVGALVAVVTMSAIFHIYLYLEATKPIQQSPARGTKIIYWIFVTVGLIMIPVIGFLVFMYGDINNFDKNVPFQNSELSLETEINGAELTAAEYYLGHNQSYVGVCDELKRVVTATTDIECNENEKAWALQGAAGSQRWCVDTDNSPKKVQTDLAGRTTCLALPQ